MEAGRGNLTLWQTESLRVTLFPSPVPHEYDPQNWWEELVGQSPDNVSSNPRLAIREVTGIWTPTDLSSGILALHVQPLRIDWRWSIPSEPDKPQVLVVADDGIAAFQKLILNWLPKCPLVHRIAFGAILTFPVESKELGYQRLSEFLPFELDASNSSDFLYRLNRPRASEVIDGKINRLSTWSVVAKTLQTLAFGGAGRIQQAESSTVFACQLELDINTAPEFPGELPSEKLPDLFHELVEFGKEMAQEGDIP